MIKRYSELVCLPTFSERLDYLRCASHAMTETFGRNRYFNQEFYRSAEWKKIRNEVIFRDNGCDLGILELPIRGKIMIHHLNPITLEDILEGNDCLIDPNNLICCSIKTHNEIHFVESIRDYTFHERSPNDTAPWRL